MLELVARDVVEHDRAREEVLVVVEHAHPHVARRALVQGARRRVVGLITVIK